MTSIALCSLKHSPGVTTLALAFATCAAGSSPADATQPLVIELDPSGGDIAARVGLSIEPGTVSLAAAGRRAASRLDPSLHSQLLPSGARVLVGPAAPDQAERTARAIAGRLVAAVPPESLAIVDCGRWSTTSPAGPAIAGAAATVVVIANGVDGVEHVRVRTDALRAATGDRVALVIAGERPYTTEEIAEACRLPVLGAVPHDERGAAGVTGALPSRAIGRAPLVRAARSILDALTGHVADPPVAEPRPKLTLIGRRR